MFLFSEGLLLPAVVEEISDHTQSCSSKREVFHNSFLAKTSRLVLGAFRGPLSLVLLTPFALSDFFQGPKFLTDSFTARTSGTSSDHRQ